MLDNQPFGLCLLGRDPLQPNYHTANILQHLGLSLIIAQQLIWRDNILNGFGFSCREKIWRGMRESIHVEKIKLKRQVLLGPGSF